MWYLRWPSSVHSRDTEPNSTSVACIKSSVACNCADVNDRSYVLLHHVTAGIWFNPLTVGFPAGSLTVSCGLLNRVSSHTEGYLEQQEQRCSRHQVQRQDGDQRHLGLSKRCCWRFRTSGMWLCVTGHIFIVVSNVQIAAIFKVKQFKNRN